MHIPVCIFELCVLNSVSKLGQVNFSGYVNILNRTVYTYFFCPSIIVPVKIKVNYELFLDNGITILIAYQCELFLDIGITRLVAHQCELFLDIGITILIAYQCVLLDNGITSLSLIACQFELILVIGTTSLIAY